MQALKIVYMKSVVKCWCSCVIEICIITYIDFKKKKNSSKIEFPLKIEIKKENCDFIEIKSRTKYTSIR